MRANQTLKDLSLFHHSTRNKNNGYRLAGIILILMGMIVLAVPFFLEVETEPSKIILVGGIPIVLGIFLISTYSGTLIDFEARKIKKYQSILWIKLGHWQKLPLIQNAELIHYTYQHQNLPNGISQTLSSEITTYKCVLTLEGREFIVFDYQKEQDAILALDRIRNGLRLS